MSQSTVQTNFKNVFNPVYPSPTASSLGKYADIPVSYHTGVPNISVPLYTINEGDLSLPISLSYHAAGIRVDEISSPIGLGWSLNAGGMISRTVNGGPDEGYTHTKAITNKAGWGGIRMVIFHLKLIIALINLGTLGECILVPLILLALPVRLIRVARLVLPGTTMLH